MNGQKMYRIWAVIALCFALSNLLEAGHEKKLSSAVVIGTVYCDTCFQQSFSSASHFISGALVAVECADAKSRTSFREEAKTNEHGEFRVHLPFSVSKHVKRIRRCSVKLIRSSEPYCAVASTATSSSLHLKSRKEGTHIFSAGFFTFKPLKQPELCNQKPSVQNPKPLKGGESSVSNPNNPTVLPRAQDLNLPRIGQNLPPLPQLPSLPPLPKLPPLPALPGLPFTPPFFPPNPFEPPPSIIPPVIPSPPRSIFPPLFPSPPPSIFPPIFPSPSPPPSIFPPIPGIPGIPGFIPSPPPPPPPIFQFPLPPFPFQPAPGFPGVPPATPSSNKDSP